MKWSIYNTIVYNEDTNYLLYNSASNKLIVIVKELKEIIESNMDNISNLHKIHPELFSYLLKENFVVDSLENEKEKVIKNRKRDDDSKEYFEIMINPTLDCNLKCWYCYETHIPGSRISEETLRSIRILAEKKISQPFFKRFTLSFFGGEPLLEFSTGVKSLIEYINSLCIKKNVELGINFTTNATLLNNEIVNFLVNTNREIFMQIPFDGGREWHNKTKKYDDGTGTYDDIITNVKYALSKGIYIMIRCNYTDKNVDSFEELIKDLRDMYLSYRKQLSFSFQCVWQTEETEHTKETIEKLSRILEEKEVDNSSYLSSSFSVCYADKENCVVINYNRDIYKCTARGFSPDIKEGILNFDGTITWNRRYYERMDAKFTYEKCLICKLFPICDICSQRKLEGKGRNECLRMYTTQDIDNHIRARIKLISRKN